MPPLAVVAGHVCLDIIPEISTELRPAEAFRPGSLLEVGAATITTGGVVSNTGLALHRLGIPTRLVGLVGRDLFGAAIAERFGEVGSSLADGLRQTDDAPTSYTIVLSAPGWDRSFLHCPGANDRFLPSDIPADATAGATVFHFGYPPLMAGTYHDRGDALAARLSEIRAGGTVISLDMARPDPAGPSGQVDWRAWMRRVLPEVDFFCPSAEEMVDMLGLSVRNPDMASVRDMADTLLEMGCRAVLLKLGEDGLYLRTADTAPAALGETWRHRELAVPCFQVEVRGTTGAGDATVAGFLAGILRGFEPEDCLTVAVATGASRVESSHGTADIPHLEAIQARFAAGWPRRDRSPLSEAWTPFASGDAVGWVGPSEGHAGCF